MLTDPVAQAFEAGNTLDFDHATQSLRDSVACLREQVPGIRFNSAYRPAEYQLHLRELWDKWQALRENDDADCATLKAAVRAEMNNHGLMHLNTRPAGATGAHVEGRAVDVDLGSLGMSLHDFVQIAIRCSLDHPLPTTDRVHFVVQNAY